MIDILRFTEETEVGVGVLFVESHIEMIQVHRDVLDLVQLKGQENHLVLIQDLQGITREVDHLPERMEANQNIEGDQGQGLLKLT